MLAHRTSVDCFSAIQLKLVGELVGEHAIVARIYMILKVRISAEQEKVTGSDAGRTTT